MLQMIVEKKWGKRGMKAGKKRRKEKKKKGGKKRGCSEVYRHAHVQFNDVVFIGIDGFHLLAQSPEGLGHVETISVNYTSE